jgi:hypothetical protein
MSRLDSRLAKILRCHMPRPLERSQYCRQQAQDCASRATTTNLPELKDAYLQLELGWLQLVPDFDPVPNNSDRTVLGHSQRRQ